MPKEMFPHICGTFASAGEAMIPPTWLAYEEKILI
jgi:hypothetical protein